MYNSITKLNGEIFFSNGLEGLAMPLSALQKSVIKYNGDSVWINYELGGEKNTINLITEEIIYPVINSSLELVSELIAYAGMPLDATVTYGVPVNAVAAQGTLTLTADTGSTILTTKTVTVGGKVYTFKTALTPTEGEVLIGINDEAALLNLLNAINYTGTPNTDYKCAAANVNVVGISSNATTLIVENKIKGVIGNLSAVATTIAGAWDDTTLGTTVAGVDGTVGDLNTIYQDVTNLYLTVGNTIADANWNKVVKASL